MRSSREAVHDPRAVRVDPRGGPSERRAMPGLLAVALLLAGCVSPAQREATERAWAERDRERAEECARRGGRYISSSCIQGGAP